MISTEGAKIILRWYFMKKDTNNESNKTNNSFVMKLFTNNVVPTVTSKKTDFVEAHGGGYIAKTLSATTWTVTTPVSGITQATQEAQSFQFIGALDTGTAYNWGPSIYGYWLEDQIGNFIGATRLPYVYTPSEGYNTYEITPVFQLGHSDIQSPVLVSADIVNVSGLVVTVQFEASDNMGVTHYSISRDPSTPVWSAVTGTTGTATMPSAGSYTLYVCVKDAMNNVSNVIQKTLTV